MPDNTALLPIRKGDNFMLGPYHFVCMGWENGRIIAMRFDGKHLIEHSLSIDVVLGPGFQKIKRRASVQ